VLVSNLGRAARHTRGTVPDPADDEIVDDE
jgi:hypothetical protein